MRFLRAANCLRRTDGGTAYTITTKNLTRLTLRETTQAREIKIDGRSAVILPRA